MTDFGLTQGMESRVRPDTGYGLNKPSPQPSPTGLPWRITEQEDLMPVWKTRMVRGVGFEPTQAYATRS